MKILIVSYYFPPFNTVGAVRVGKTAKYLAQAGHEVKVITANNQPLMKNLPVEIPEENIIRTAWFDVNKPVQLLLGGRKSVATKGYESARRLPWFVKTLGYFYRNWINFPDGQIGWYPYAVNAGKKLLKTWTPDVILGSCPPLNSFLVTRKLSKLYHIPWIADFRDLWADNCYAYKYYSRLRSIINFKLEKNILSTASGLITVSKPLADELSKRYSQKISVVANGYDLEDYPSINKKMVNDSTLNIVFTGTFFPGELDPLPLIQSLVLLRNEAQKISVSFYGKNNAGIKSLAEKHGVGDYVHCYDVIPYRESLQQQVNADILLLLSDSKNNTPAEKGLVSAKFYEYLGARKPILLLGCLDGIAANIIKMCNAGLAENDPQRIAAYLRQCMYNKENQITNDLPFDVIKGFSRQERTGELIACLEEIRSRANRQF